MSPRTIPAAKRTATPSPNGNIDATNIRAKETAKIETVTPAQAQRWLEGNVDNRKLRESTVLRYSGMLQRSEFELTGDCLVFDDQGVLINGQHRLTAVVVADTPARFVILRGVPSKNQEVMDQGLLRSLGDQLHRRGVPNSATVAGALNWLAQFEYNEATGNVHYADNQSMRPTYRQSLWRFDHSPGLVEMAPSMSRLVYYLKIRPGPTLAIKYRLSKINKEEAELFFEQLKDGTGLARNDPIWRLREWCLSDARTRHTTGRAPAYRYCAMVFKAWNLWRDGFTVNKLAWVYTPTKKESWPTPH